MTSVDQTAPAVPSDAPQAAGFADTAAVPTVGLIGWRGMVGSVLMQRMTEEGDFAKVNPVFFSTSNAGGDAPVRRPEGREACLACHLLLPERPGDFPQVVPAEHYRFVGVADPGTHCTACHDPHEPLFMDRDLRQARLQEHAGNGGDSKRTGARPLFV